jgi:hypothetical protein
VQAGALPRNHLDKVDKVALRRRHDSDR